MIIYDRRGRGESTDAQPYAVQREIEDIEALVEAVGPSQVVGVSSGTALALEAAASGVPVLSVRAFEPPYAVGEHRQPCLTACEVAEQAPDMGGMKVAPPFPKTAKLKRGETVVFSWIVFRSRKERDRGHAKVMKDPRVLATMDRKMPFDVKRMVYGGFTTIVDQKK